MTTPILAWHFTDGPKLRDGRPLTARTYRYRGKLVMCKSGLHASVRAIDALMYARGSWVSRVECSGDLVVGNDKLVCSVRRVLWFADATDTLREFKRAQALSAAHLWDCPRTVREYVETGRVDARAAWAAIAAGNLDLERRLMALEPTT